jgi:hypothetical protein
LVEDLDLGILKTRAQETHYFFQAWMEEAGWGGDILWLDGSLGFELIVAQSHVEIMQHLAHTSMKPLRLNGSASHDLSLHYTLAFTLQ